MDIIYYTVARIDGDYAHLQRDGAENEELKLVARALLPDGIQEGSRVKYEMFEYELLN